MSTVNSCNRLSRGCTKEERKAHHVLKMGRKKALRNVRHAEYQRSRRAKDVARWAAWVRTSWHKSIWPAAKVERRRAGAGA